jgi:D-alanyl-D-alanine dipeptidase
MVIISRKMRMALFLCLLPLCLRAQPREPVEGYLALSRQVVVVTAADWTATKGSLQRFEFERGHWQPVGPVLPVVLGSNGLGWGAGLHTNNVRDPQKRDGDGRSPAGVFRLPYCFGYAPPDEVRIIRMPYIQCTGRVDCVEDTNSTYYNIVKDRLTAEVIDWKKAEPMRLADEQYRLGVFVENNCNPSLPGFGACIFLHIWKGPGETTKGGTGMKLGAMESLVGWLDPRSNPLLVQLPLAEYRRYEAAWHLPPLPVFKNP